MNSEASFFTSRKICGTHISVGLPDGVGLGLDIEGLIRSEEGIVGDDELTARNSLVYPAKWQNMSAIV